MASFAVTAGCLMLLLCCAGMAHAQHTNSTMAGPEDDYEQPTVPSSPGASFNGTTAVTRANFTRIPYNSSYIANGTLSETSLAAIKTQALDAVLGGDFNDSPMPNCLLLSSFLDLLSAHQATSLACASAGASAAVGGVGQSATPVPTTAQTFSGASSQDALGVGGNLEPPDQVCLLQLCIIM